ncbi:MAG: hypothetical protein ACJAVV_001452 [Alphaproteobacteria bacterium]|jgi:hypothetical protein
MAKALAIDPYNPRFRSIILSYDAEANFYWARYYGVLGDKKGCFRLLGRALDNGYFSYPFM